MLKVSKVSNTLPNKKSKAMLKVSKVVFAAFMKHYIQGNVTHVRGVESELYSVYRASHPSRREGYLKSLPSCGFSSSPPVSLRRQLC